MTKLGAVGRRAFKRYLCDVGLLTILLLFKVTPVLARFGGGVSGGFGGGVSGGHSGWFNWVTVLVVLLTLIKILRHQPHWYCRTSTADRQAVTALFERFQVAWARGDISELRPTMSALAYTHNEAILAKELAQGKREIIKNIQIRRVRVRWDQRNARIRTFKISGRMVNVVVNREDYTGEQGKGHPATYFKDLWTIDFGFDGELRVIAVKNLS